MRPFSVGCRAKNVFSGELAVPRKCNNTPAHLASTSFTGGKLSLALFPSMKKKRKRRFPYLAFYATLQMYHPLRKFWLTISLRIVANCVSGAKQPSPGSAISKEEICSSLSFVFAGGVLNSQGRDNPRTPKKKLRERLFLGHGRNSSSRGKKKDLRCFRTWAQQLDPVVDL